MGCGNRWAAGLAVAAGVAFAPAVQAVAVTSVPGDIDLRVVHFTPYDAVTTETVVSGAIDVGTAETSEVVNLSFGLDGELRILGAVPTDLGSNGQWPGRGGAYAGLDAASGEMTFRFSRGMNFVGGFINFDPGAFDGSVTLTAYSATDDVLEDLVLDFNLANPAGLGLGQFHGFARASADIWRITLSNSEVVLDDLSFGTTRVAAVPAAKTAPLLGAALLAATLAFCARRRASASQGAAVRSRSASRT